MTSMSACRGAIWPCDPERTEAQSRDSAPSDCSLSLDDGSLCEPPLGMTCGEAGMGGGA
jgi:hypothetical protein